MSVRNKKEGTNKTLCPNPGIESRFLAIPTTTKNPCCTWYWFWGKRMPVLYFLFIFFSKGEMEHETRERAKQTCTCEKGALHKTGQNVMWSMWYYAGDVNIIP